MAIKKNISISKNEYTRYLGAFRGVDFSSDPSEVADYRLSNSVNMYKDYRSGQGQAIETIPGFRLTAKLDGKIYGIHVYQVGDKKTLFVHAGDKLYKASDINFDENTEWTQIQEKITYEPFNDQFDQSPLVMSERKSTSFNFNNRLYIIDGSNYIYFEDNYNNVVYDVSSNSYTPTTHILLRPDNSELKEPESSGEYSQQNILSPRYKATYVADGKCKSFSLPLGVDEGFEHRVTHQFEYVLPDGTSYPVYGIPATERFLAFFNNYKVYQYGVELPWATPDGGIPYYVGPMEEIDGITVVREAFEYPNAILSISPEGVVTLVNPPPLPEDNEFSEVDTVPVKGEYPYPAGSAGIEIIATKTINTIKGITSSKEDIGSIITGCTIATVFDDRVFLSGNSEFPNFVFFNGINPETGYSDPSYFGVLNWFSEGVTNTPITGLMPIADTLMVLRRDTVQDGSITFRSRVDTGEQVVPVTYQGTAGLPGTGCLGAFCNFRDDPCFVSKYGLEAMGQLSARYERSVEHRSYLIDGLLLNKDLSKACITEFESYLVLLIEGEIFLADSRQIYTHSSGVAQYEWFYLNDIGIYKDQKREAVYIDVPDEYKGQTFTNDYNGLEYTIASIDDLYRDDRDYVSQIGRVITGNYASGITDYGKSFVYISESKENVRYAIPVKLLESYGGGSFCPATLIKAIDNEHLIFGTDEGHICCFNFDKRDPNDDFKIPNEFYDFNGRTIKSALVTKMDNCNIPHLTKSTVKKSMIVKMRTFPISSAKIRVRTNRQSVTDVERVVGGRFGFDGFDFADLTYETGEKNLFRVREREKKWVEKQLYFVSEEFRQPFSLNYITYGYHIAGRYKD